MEDILETIQLEFDKSSFLIDIVRHNSGRKYIEINQKIHDDTVKLHSVKINPSILNEIIEVLRFYQKKVSHDKDGVYIWEETKEKIQNRYLKGIPLKDLELQFGIKKELIEMILRNRGIEIVSNKIPKKRSYKRRYKKR